MGTYSDPDLSSLAPNIVVRIGTPPVFTPSVVPASSIKGWVFTKSFISDIGLLLINKDQTSNLAGLARTNHLLYFHIKIYGTTGKIVSSKPSSPPLPPPPPPPLGPPSPPHIFTTGDANDLIPWIDEAPPFVTIDYIPQDLVGLKPPANPPKPPPFAPPTGSPPGPPTTTTTTAPKNPKTWSPLELASLLYYQNFPSAIFVPAIQSCISTPYFAPEAKRHLNGVLNSASNPLPGNTCYLWQSSTKGKNRQFPNIRPRTDGAILLASQPKDSTTPYDDVFIQPGKWELMFGIKNGNLLNAFSLILGIQGGGNENQPQTKPWDVEIAFGAMTIQIIENSPGVKVIVGSKGKVPSPPQEVEVKPSTAPYVTNHFGERPYLLTFIPVWNGILMSHGVPASSDWGDTVRFFQKDESLEIQTQVAYILGESQNQTQEEKDKGINPFPPRIKVKREGEYYNAPGIFVKGANQGSKTSKATPSSNYDFNMGDKLTLRFTRCGGVFKFVPIWFTPYSKYHYLFAGPADPGDIPSEAPTRRNNPPKSPKGTPPSPKVDTTIPSEPDVFNVTSKTTKIVLPVLNFSTDDLDFRTHLTTIVKSASKPFGCLSMEFQNVQPDVRRPIQVWGAVIGENASLVSTAALFPPNTDEGYLTDTDLPWLRIRRFSISRGLDGANGEIVWDRNDPISGPMDRPPQKIGAIQVAIYGGANTSPRNSGTPPGGIVFTGIAMGNSQENSPDENVTRVPLRGREAKLDSDGGILLWNSPIFDGWDHKDAMAFLANYAGVPFDSRWASDFRLIDTLDTEKPLLFFPSGTGVAQAMDTVTKQTMSLFYFDRVGILRHIDSEVSTGKKWYYPDATLESFSDEPDFQWMRNELIVVAQIGSKRAQTEVAKGTSSPTSTVTLIVPSEVIMIRVPITTNPKFPWARQAIYQIPQILPSSSEAIRIALRFAEARGRPRATSRCQIPPNADIELLDILNDSWIITSISHEADTQTKKWTMSLGVEMFVAAPENVGPPLFRIDPA